MPTGISSDVPDVNQAPVAWAQKKDQLFLTICVEDCKDPDIQITDNKLHFRGSSGNAKTFECLVEFFKDVDSSKARKTTSDRNIQYVIPKKEPGPFWPRLLKDTAKVHWVKVDFQKWKDEDESDGEWGGPTAGGGDFESMMQGLGGGYGGGNKDYDDFEDSDEEGLPDLEDDVKADEAAAKEAAVDKDTEKKAGAEDEEAVKVADAKQTD